MAEYSKVCELKYQNARYDGVEIVDHAHPDSTLSHKHDNMRYKLFDAVITFVQTMDGLCQSNPFAGG